MYKLRTFIAMYKSGSFYIDNKPVDLIPLNSVKVFPEEGKSYYVLLRDNSYIVQIVEA